MDQTVLRMMELGYDGYNCSQILLMLALEAQGKVNHDLIRAMSGLAHGYGADRGICGTLTGAACLLGLYAGKGSADDFEDEQLKYLLKELEAWFSQTFGGRYGGITCADIIGDRTEIRQRCSAVVAGTWAKATELLVSAGYDLSRSKE